MTANSSVKLDDTSLDVDKRVAFFRDIEAELITSPDDELRFHSGVPSFI